MMLEGGGGGGGGGTKDPSKSSLPSDSWERVHIFL